MRRMLLIALAFFVQLQSALAQTDVCGDPPVVVDETLKGEIEGKAEFVSKFLGQAELSGQIETSRSDIFNKYPDANTTRSNAFFEYQVCVLLMNDSTLTNLQKIEELKKIKKEFSKPVSSVFQVIIRASDAFIDNEDIGFVYGKLSYLKLYIDNELIVDMKLSESFSDVIMNLQQGKHTFEYEAKIRSETVKVEDNCAGFIEIQSDTILEPYIQFEARTEKSGVISDCSLDYSS